jgi:hypothetical protein
MNLARGPRAESRLSRTAAVGRHASSTRAADCWAQHSRSGRPVGLHRRSTDCREYRSGRPRPGRTRMKRRFRRTECQRQRRQCWGMPPAPRHPTPRPCACSSTRTSISAVSSQLSTRCVLPSRRTISARPTSRSSMSGPTIGPGSTTPTDCCFSSPACRQATVARKRFVWRWRSLRITPTRNRASCAGRWSTRPRSIASRRQSRPTRRRRLAPCRCAGCMRAASYSSCWTSPWSSTMRRTPCIGTPRRW